MSSSSSSPRKRKFNDTSSSISTTKYTKPKPKGRLCSVQNCTKQVQQGGVCCRHGAKTTRATCSHDKCTNVAKRGGLCRRHGAFNLETCAFVGCRRCVKRGRKFCDGHYDNAIATTVDVDTANAAAGGDSRVTTTTTISTTTTDNMSSSNRAGQCGPCICNHEGCSNVSNRGGVCNRHDCVGVSRTKRHTNTPPNTTSSSSLAQSPDNMYQLGGYNNNNNTATSYPTPLVTGSTDSSVEVEVESSTFVEPGLQFNFLCDYFEDLYEEFPV
mmetsp:Transcript_19821/g.41550  ORF Transcript_19821/g.41550 Transcript_19821/m.41550 type:complete len:270 (+) Transcript_19821:20-829(+)